jgi:hypothetical protein
MGSAVKKVTSVIAPGGQKALDAVRGKVETPTGYNPNASAFQNSKEQQDYQNLLKAQASGQVDNSIAQQQLQSATNRNIAQIAGTAAKQRNNQALALRQAFRSQADANQQAAAQSGLLRAEEMQAAQNAYGADLTRQQQAAQNLEGMKSGIAGATQQLQFAANLNKQQQTKDLFQQGANAAMMMSDKNVKKDIKEINPKDIEDFATKLKASSFKYKSPNGESYQDGSVSGIMAQDLEKSKIGKQMVINGPEGKMVDMKKAVPATLAAVSEVMKRIKKLESKKEEA